MNAKEIKDLIASKIAGQGTMVDIGGALPVILNEIVDAIGEGGGDSVRKITVDAELEALPSDVVGSVKAGDILSAKNGLAIVTVASDSQVVFSQIPPAAGSIYVTNYSYKDGTWVLDELG